MSLQSTTWSALLEWEHILNTKFIHPVMFKLLAGLKLEHYWLTGEFGDELITIRQIMQFSFKWTGE